MNTNPYRFISRPAIMILLAALASPGRLSSSLADGDRSQRAL